MKWKGGNILLYVRESILAKFIDCDFPASASFYIEINLHKKWLLNCSYCPQKNNVCNHVDVITKTLDMYYGKYKNVFLSDFNGRTEETRIEYFCKSCNLNSLKDQPSCFKNSKKPSCIDLILTSKPK